MQGPALFGVPPPFEAEALTSWLTRLTLSQGVGLWEVLQFLGVDPRHDPDRRLHGEALWRVRRLCGLPAQAFAIPDRVMQSLALMGSHGDRYMARSGRSKARFRFCVCCLSEMTTPHFPIHWRFIAWRRCPVHDCLMEDACPNCRKPVLLPANIESSNAGRAGLASLDRCLSCGSRLTTTPPCLLQADGVRFVHAWEDQQMANGRALLAALVNRSFRIEGRNETFPLEWLADLARKRAYPLRFEWLTPDTVRMRWERRASPAR